jgi:LacI family transcriptional regulator
LHKIWTEFTHNAMTRITLKQIGKEAGVSEATVSRILRGQSEQHRIRTETEEKVLKAAKRLGFRPRVWSFKPRPLRTKTIGLIIPDLSHYFLAELTRTIVDKARSHGLSVTVRDSLEDDECEKECIEAMWQQNVDGLLLLPVGRHWKHIQQSIRRDTPVVIVDRIMPDLDCHCVGINNYQGAFNAVNYLIERGHTRIGCIQRLPDSWISEERVRGYYDAHRQHGIKIDESLIVGNEYGQRNGYLETKKLLQRTEVPTAVFALSHLSTLGALRALREHHISIPEDMSVVGFDDLPNADYFTNPITTVRQPIREMATTAIELLVELIESKQFVEPMTVMLSTELVRRESVRIIR